MPPTGYIILIGLGVFMIGFTIVRGILAARGARRMIRWEVSR